MSVSLDGTTLDAKPLHGFEPFTPRGGLVTNDLVNQLREDD